VQLQFSAPQPEQVAGQQQPFLLQPSPPSGGEGRPSAEPLTTTKIAKGASDFVPLSGAYGPLNREDGSLLSSRLSALPGVAPCLRVLDAPAPEDASPPPTTALTASCAAESTSSALPMVPPIPDAAQGFGRIAQGLSSKPDVLRDEHFVTFHDHVPRATIHLLTLPRTYIRDIDSLVGAGGAQLVTDMIEHARAALSQVVGSGFDADRTLLGFHVSSFVSVPWLHLHSLYPRDSITDESRYTPRVFVTPSAVLARLHSEQLRLQRLVEEGLLLPSGAAAPIPNAAELAALDGVARQQLLGERLYACLGVALGRRADLAAKITGMLLELEEGEILEVLNSPERLIERAAECVAIIDTYDPAADRLVVSEANKSARAAAISQQMKQDMAERTKGGISEDHPLA
jgi:diadenosine tetraphosphate (Ap4A) HIT family hydrolase